MCVIGHWREWLWGLMGLLSREALQSCLWIWTARLLPPLVLCVLWGILWDPRASVLCTGCLQVFRLKPFRYSVSLNPFTLKIPRKQQVKFYLFYLFLYFHFVQLFTLSSSLGLSILMVNVLISCFSSEPGLWGHVNYFIFNLPSTQVPLLPSQAFAVSAGLLPPGVDDEWISPQF